LTGFKSERGKVQVILKSSLWVGLTGGIATGKSTVSSYLRSCGIPVVDADEVAHQVVEPGTKGLQEIESQFGPDYIDQSGHFNRKKMADLVFKDRTALLKLEKIIHPLVQSRVIELRRQFESQGHKVIVYDVPLLFEKNLQDQFDRIILVTSLEAHQLERMKTRNAWPLEESKRRILNQIPLIEKESRSDFIIVNNSDLKSLYLQVDDVIKNLIAENKS
jgi:dephospho-CoA kinase